MNGQAKSPVVIAVCGKGGTGKTVVSALLTRLLTAKPGGRVLAIDADPAVGLLTALGVEATRTVDDIRNELIRRIGAGQTLQKRELLATLDYELFASLAERNNLACLAIGRPESEGCYCQVNSLLRDIIRNTASGFDHVVIDSEAGIEQVNRRVFELVTHLLLVTDVSIRGRRVADVIERVARKTVIPQKTGVIFNRIRRGHDVSSLVKGMRLQALGYLPEDDAVALADQEGRSLLDLPECEALAALRAMMADFIEG